MYKSTRHANKMWTYAAGSLGPYIGIGENIADEIISKCRTSLITCRLLTSADFSNFQPDSAPLAKTRFVNGRLRSGHAYLRRLGIPAEVMSAVPNWLMIAPKLGKVISNIGLLQAGEIDVELFKLHQYLQVHRVSTRPLFSSLAYRVQVAKVPAAPKTGSRVKDTPAKQARQSTATSGAIVQKPQILQVLDEAPGKPSTLSGLQAPRRDNLNLKVQHQPRSIAKSGNQANNKQPTAMAMALSLALKRRQPRQND